MNIKKCIIITIVCIIISTQTKALERAVRLFNAYEPHVADWIYDPNEQEDPALADISTRVDKVTVSVRWVFLFQNVDMRILCFTPNKSYYEIYSYTFTEESDEFLVIPIQEPCHSIAVGIKASETNLSKITIDISLYQR